MPEHHEYFIYILANRSRTLYTGVTNDLVVRVLQHRQGKVDSFTTRYRIHRLVYFERFAYIDRAIAREKYIKHMTRDEKLSLISSMNPTWADLATNPQIAARPL